MLKEKKMEKKKLMAKDEIKRFIKENNIKDIAGIEESFEYSKNEVYTKYLTNPNKVIKLKVGGKNGKNNFKE